MNALGPRRVLTSIAIAIRVWPMLFISRASPFAGGPGAGLGRIGRERGPQPGVRVAIGVVLIALMAVAGIVGLRGTGLDARVAFGLACWATLLVSPLAWGHYFMVELPALLCVPVWLWRRGLLRLAKVMALAPVVLSWGYYMAMSQVGGSGILGLGTAGWFLVGCGVILWAGAAKGSIEGRISGVLSRPHSGAGVRIGGLERARLAESEVGHGSGCSER